MAKHGKKPPLITFKPMPLICDCCGKKIEKYCVVKYEIEYLEKYLSEYYNMPIVDIMSKNAFKQKDMQRRSVCFRIFSDFSKLSQHEINQRYSLWDSKATRSKQNLDISNPDYKFINKDLLNQLPETIKYKY